MLLCSFAVLLLGQATAAAPQTPAQSTTTTTPTAAPLPFVASIFSDHMVLQRDMVNTIWGWTKPGHYVKVVCGSKAAAAYADSSGKWTARFSPPPVGGPYKISVASGDQKADIEDVMVGDVWLCAGQSNMEFGILDSLTGDADIKASYDPGLRVMEVPHQVGFTPLATADVHWEKASLDSLQQGSFGGFSAVGYYFGRSLRRKLGVPIGLVQVTWGGSAGESWTSAKELNRLGGFDDQLEEVKDLGKSSTAVFGTYMDLWLSKHDTGGQSNWQSPDFDDSGWAKVKVPDGISGLGLGDAESVTWYRREFTLPDKLVFARYYLNLANTDSFDKTWVNGFVVGTQSGATTNRHYWLKPQILKPGKNVIVTRLFGKRGFISKPEEINITYGDSVIPLAGEWKAAVGVNLKDAPMTARDRSESPTVPTVLYNGMVAPLAPAAIKGIIWYQGETNFSRAAQYSEMVPHIVSSWRNAFDQGDLPFYFVTLAGFKQRQEQPAEDGWAEIRDAQINTANSIRSSGYVITTDLGDPDDIHPKNKKPVGDRLALLALNQAYGAKEVCYGPTYSGFTKQSGAIIVQFDNTDRGLVAKGKLEGFQIAGEDKVWHWADAKISGTTVVVSSPSVPKPVAVRYDWQANPPVTLFNGAGLPASPFRTDTWPLSTEGRK